MPLPTLEQYFSILDNKESGALSKLRDYHFLYTDNSSGGVYDFRHGTSAVVFKAEKGGKKYAIRLFLRDEPQIFKRYDAISEYLSSKVLPWKLDFIYLNNEILFGDKRLPAVAMDWAEGLHLNRFIDEAVYSHSALSRLQEKLIELSESLEDNGIGHGDLKFDNLIIDKKGDDFSITLVDYDSMYVPALAGEKNLEPGSPGYQHPWRLASHFSETMDRFSVWVMITALEAIKADSSLWTDPSQIGFKPEKNLLFTLKDFINPNSSKLFQKLKTYKNEALHFYTDHLIRFCQLQQLDRIEKPVLYEVQVLAKLGKPEIKEPQQNTEPAKSHLHSPGKKEAEQPAIAEAKEQLGEKAKEPVQKTTPVQPKADPLLNTSTQETLHEVEIKSSPSGRDVLVRGIKRGITPLKLSLPKNDLDYVEVRDDDVKLKVHVNPQLSSYEIGFPKKEPPVIQPLQEQDEILEFSADKYNATEGELATINWRVKGNSKIHISNIGEVDEKTGRKRIVLNDTTNYVLTVGSKKRSLTIRVERKPKPEPKIDKPEPKIEQLISKAKANIHTKETVTKPAKRSFRKAGIIAIGLVLVLALTLLVYNLLSNKPDASQNTQHTNTAGIGSVPNPGSAVFSRANVTTFLNELYAAYNKRDLTAILDHYGNSLTEYYDSTSLSKASLISIIDDLFLSPESYSCKPDYSTLKTEPGDKHCKIIITITENLKYDASSRRESYQTTIEYIVDSSFKIVSEKHG